MERMYHRCVDILELRSRYRVCTPSFRTHRCEAERLFASARNKGFTCAKRIEIPLCLHLPCVFFLRSLFIPGGPIGPIGELCPRADPYVGYVCMRNEKIASGEREDQCVMEDPLSLSLSLSFPLTLRRAFRGSHGRVTMNGRYYFIGDQAKSKIEKRTGRDERK